MRALQLCVAITLALSCPAVANFLVPSPCTAGQAQDFRPTNTAIADGVAVVLLLAGADTGPSAWWPAGRDFSTEARATWTKPVADSVVETPRAPPRAAANLLAQLHCVVGQSLVKFPSDATTTHAVVSVAAQLPETTGTRSRPTISNLNWGDVAWTAVCCPNATEHALASNGRPMNDSATSLLGLTAPRRGPNASLMTPTTNTTTLLRAAGRTRPALLNSTAPMECLRLVGLLDAGCLTSSPTGTGNFLGTANFWVGVVATLCQPRPIPASVRPAAGDVRAVLELLRCGAEPTDVSKNGGCSVVTDSLACPHCLCMVEASDLRDNPGPLACRSMVLSVVRPVSQNCDWLPGDVGKTINTKPHMRLHLTLADGTIVFEETACAVAGSSGEATADNGSTPEPSVLPLDSDDSENVETQHPPSTRAFFRTTAAWSPPVLPFLVRSLALAPSGGLGAPSLEALTVTRTVNPRPALALLLLILLCSRRSASRRGTSLLFMLALSAVALLATVSASPTCTQATAPNGEGVSLFAPQWPHIPTNTPTLGNVDAVEVTAAVTVSGIDVAVSFSGSGGASGVYLSACSIPANGTLWPWGGLQVDAVLCNGATVRALIPGWTCGKESGTRAMLALPGSGARGVCMGGVDVFAATASILANLLWINGGNGGNGVFAEEGAAQGVADGPADAGREFGFDDADGDGWVDLVVTRHGDVVELYMNGVDTLVEDGGGRGVSAGTRGPGVPWGVNGDIDVDLFMCDHGRMNRLFVNDGATKNDVDRGVGTLTRKSWRPALAVNGQDVLGTLSQRARGSTRVAHASKTSDGLWKRQPASVATPRLGAASQAARLAFLVLALAAGAFASSSSQRRATQPFLLRLLVRLCLVWAVSASSPTCTRLTVPPNGEVVAVCAPPWPRTPTAAPTAGDPVTIDVTFASSTTGLLLVSAEVNGLDVGGSFADGGGGVYSVTYTTGAGDEDWPWVGLGVGIVLSDSGGGLFAEVNTTVVAGTTWSEESDARGMAVLDDGSGAGVCMGDVDGDGDVDVFVAMWSGTANQLWINNGSGVFVDEGGARGVAGDASDIAHACGFGDADGDGWVDLVVTRYVDDLIELYMNDDGTFLEDGAARGVSAGDDSLGVSWGDVDGDGDVDLFVCSYNSQRNMLFMNDGAGVFTEDGVGRGVGTLARNSGQSVLVDIDGDGDLDILVVNFGHANELYVNVGGGDYEEAGVSRGFADAGNGRGVSVGDRNGDGVVDVYVTNRDSRDLLLLNDGSGVFSDVGVGAGIGASTGRSFGVVTFDIESDGDVDVVVGVDSGSDYVWVNDGVGGFVDGSADLALGSSAFTRGVAAGDVDADGDVDVIMGWAGNVYVSHSAEGGVGRSVVVRPLTEGGAQSAFGAAVWVECVDGCEDGWVGVRVIDGGSSVYSQTSYDAVIGVPVPSGTYNVSVRWAGDAHPPCNWTSHPRLGGVVPSTLAAVEDRLFIVRPYPVSVTVGGARPWDYVGVTTRDVEGAALPTAGTVIEFPIVVSPWGSTADLVVVSGNLSGRPSTPTLTMGLLGNGTISFVIGEEDVDWPWAGVECAVTLTDSGGLVSSNASTLSIPGMTWSEESDARGMAASANINGYGVCMGDVDGDGDVDVFVAMEAGTANQLWVNDGGGVFVDEGVARGVAGNASDTAWGCGFGDADGDGWVDLAVTRYTDDVIELYMNGGGTFVEDGAGRGVSAVDDSVGVSWGDVDGDGDADLFVCGYFGKRNRLFMNDGAGVFTEDGVDRGVGTLTRWSYQLAVVDIDGDGDLDVLVVNNGANELYLNGGDGNFEEAGVSRGFADAGNSVGVSVGDWSGDGVVDVYVTNYDSRDLLLLNDGSGVFSEVGVGAGIGASTGRSHGVVMFDIENDGDVDVVVGVQSGADYVWVNDGVGGFVDGSADLALGSVASTRCVSAGDIDGDGDVDVIMGNSGAVYVSHSAEGGVGRIIFVRPLTAGGALSAFGAAVRVECVGGCEDGWVGVRVIDGGSSDLSQPGYDAVVGVPVHSAAYNVSVRWAGDFHPPSNWTSYPRLGGVVPSMLTSVEDQLFVVRPYPVTVTVGGALPWDYPGVTTRFGEGAAPPVAGTVIEFPIVVSPWGSTLDLDVVSGSLNGRPSTPTLNLGLSGIGTISFVIGGEDVDWPWGGVECSVTLVDSGGLVSSNTSTFSIPGTTWSEESDTRGMAALDNDNGFGVCMGDVDGDGDVDVFAAIGLGTLNQLWVNDGSGVFVDEGAARGVAGHASYYAVGCGFGDADGDGWVDLIVTRGADDVIELYMNDGGTFVEDGEGRGVSVGDDSVGVSWGDVDGDGDVDMFVCSSNSKRNRLFMNDGAAAFTEDGAGRGVGTLTRSSIHSALVDIDGDGDLDVLVVNTVANELYVNGGDGDFQEAGVSRGFADAGDGRGVSVGDWSGDGVVDVYIANSGSGDLLLLNDGGGVFSEVGVGAGNGVSTGASVGVVTFDIENDGDVDMVVGDQNAVDYVWVNDGLGRFVDGSVDLALGSTARTYGVSAGDIDGDGDVDVIMGYSGDVYVSHSAEGGVGRIIFVRPLTAEGTQSAFGAAVRVDCVDGCEDGWVGMRVIDGGSSYLSQSAYDAVIGVPVPSATYNMSVRWAGDFHPPSNWTSHPGLGGVVPSTLASVEDRLFIVRPFPFPLVVNQPLPWDFAGVTVRTVDPSPPAPGDTILLSMTVPSSAIDLSLVLVFINAQNAASTFTRAAPGTYTLLYTTTAGQTSWPWTGLHVVMTLVDGIGLVFTLDDYIVPGTTLEESAASTGLGLMPSTARGLCMGDIDGDGDIDLFVTSATGHRTFANSGSGFFTDNTLTSGVQGSDDGAGCAMADVDGDGDLDVLVVPAGLATNQLFVQTVPGVFVEEAGARGVSGTSITGQSVAFGDVNGDGSIDAYVCASGGANQLYTNGGAGTFTLATAAASISPSMAAALVDIDGDADLDIVVVNDGVADELFVNSGDGSFLQRAGVRGFAHEGSARGLAFGDMTGDGLVEVVVTQVGGRSLVYVNGGGSFEERGVQLGLTGLTDNVDAVMTDVDHDGDLDVVAGSATGAEAVWISAGESFTDHSAPLGVTSANASRLSLCDIDGDGDVDILTAGTTKVYLNHNAQPDAPNWITVQPMTASGSSCAPGTALRLTCVTGCESRPWFGVRFMTSDSGCQPAYFGLPAWGSTFDVSATFVGGATHDKRTDPALGGVTPGTTLTVVDRPYLTDITAIFHPATTLGINDTVVLTLWAGLGRADLVPAPTCCFINNVQVRDTFVGGGDGMYNLTYVVSEGDAEWEVGTLGLIPTLQSSSHNLTMVELEYELAEVPGGDPVQPSIQFDCRPGTASANVWEPICVSCPGEDACTFSYTVESTTLLLFTAQVPASNYTSPTAATFFVGPFNDSDIVSLVVFAEDGAGNPATPDTFSWRVDTSSPVTTLVEKPDPVTQRTGASFTLQCSEAACTFAYRFNGGVLTQVGGNGTTAEDVLIVHTELVVAPARVSNVNSPWVAFSVNASDPGMLVNATVEVSLGSQRWALGVEGNMTAPLQLPVLADGMYVLGGVGKSRDGISDVTPVQYVFTVDTERPVATILQAPFDGDGSAQPTIVMGCSEDDCTYLWRSGLLPLNSSSWQLAEFGVMQPTVESVEEHGFEVRPVDAAGNVGEAVSVTWSPVACPSTVPPVAITSSVDVGGGHRHISFSSMEDGTAFEYRLDGGMWVAAASSTVLLTDLAPGLAHTVEARAAVPSVCNACLAATRPPPTLSTWSEAGAPPPQVSLLTFPDANTPDVFAEFQLLPTVRQSWLEYSLDGEPWIPCSTTLVVGPLQAGEHTMRVRAMTEGGESGDTQAHTWTITAASDSSIVLSGLPDGVHTLVVIATDDAGSFEVAPKTFEWRVDTVPPVITGNMTTPRFSTSRMAVVEVACEGEIDPCVFCWTSSTVPNNCSDVSPVYLEALDDGEHVVDVRAVDSVGLVSESGVDVLWTVDSTPPRVAIGDVGDMFIAPLYDTGSVDAVVGSASVQLNLTADEVVAGYYVTLNGEQWPPDGMGLVTDSLPVFDDLQSIINAISVAGVDPSGNVGEPVVLQLLVDVAAPAVTTFTSPLPELTKEAVVVANVACTDAVGGSGARHIAVMVDGEVFGQVAGSSGSLSLPEWTSGVYNVSAACVDVAGNVDPYPIWSLVQVDQDPPVSSFSVDLPAYSASPTVLVWVEANEVSAVYGRVAGLSDWVVGNGSGVATFAELPDGLHRIEVRAIDVVGNVELEPFTTADIVVDTVKPELYWTEPPVMYTSSPIATGCFAANDSNPVTFSVESPPAAVIGDDACLTLAIDGDGEASVELVGEDAAGNVGDVLPATWVLDTAPPAVVVTSPVSASPACFHGNTTACGGANSATITLGCSDGSPDVPVSPCRPQAAIKLEEAAAAAGCVQSTTRRLADNSDFLDAPIGEFTLATADGDGRYSVSVRAVDGAGNVEAVPTVFEWFVDTVNPVRPSLIQAPEGIVAVTTASFVVQLVGDNSPGQTVFRYALDGGAETAVGDLPEDVDDDVVLQLSGLDGGAHSLALWAVDQAGNVGQPVLHNWEVVNTAPATVMLSGPAAVSGDATPGFVFAARWRDRAVGNGSEPGAAIEVSLNGAPEYTVICEDTLASGGICVWNATLVEVGEYTLNVRADLAGIAGDPSTVNWEYKQCSDAEFALIGDNGGIGCFACPPGGNCVGGLTTQSGIAAVQGFWAPPGSTGERFYECPVEEACLPGGALTTGNVTTHLLSRCAEGYTGTLCAVCDDGYFERFGKCAQCEGTKAVSAVWPVLTSIAFVASAVMSWRYAALLPKQTIKIVFSMTQVVALCSSAYDIPWPPTFKNFLAGMQVFLLDLMALTRAECAQPMNYFTSSAVTFVLYKLVLVVVLLVTYLWHHDRARRWRHSRRQSRRERVDGLTKVSGSALPAPASSVTTSRTRSVQLYAPGTPRLRRASMMFRSLTTAEVLAPLFRTLFLFLFMTYGGLTLRVFRLFKCVEVAGTWWLVQDMRLQCFTPQWYRYAVYAAVMGIVFVLGLPCAVGGVLVRNRHHLHDPVVVKRWGFLYEKYGEQAWMWEAEELLRRLVMTAIPLLLSDGTAFQTAVAVMVCGWAHVLHGVFKPWGAGTRLYFLQHAALTVTSFIFLMGLMFKVDGVTHGSTTFDALAWAMVFASSAFVVVGLVLAAAKCHRNCRRQRSRNKLATQPAKTEAADSTSGDRPQVSPSTVRRPGSTIAWQSNPLGRPGGLQPSRK